MDPASQKIMSNMMGTDSEKKKPPSACPGHLSPNTDVLSAYERETIESKKACDFYTTQTPALMHASFPPLTSLNVITFREC